MKTKSLTKVLLLFTKYTLKFVEEEREKIIIGNEVIDRGRIDLLSKHMLKSCNYFHSKNKNNNHNIKKGEGKSMITNGLTVSDFNKKYHLDKIIK